MLDSLSIKDGELTGSEGSEVGESDTDCSIVDTSLMNISKE